MMKSVSINPKVKDILFLLTAGSLIVSSLVAPGAAVIAKEVLKAYEQYQRNQKKKEWEKLNPWRLSQLITRMQNSRYIEVGLEKGLYVVKITEKGKSKLLKYDLDKLKLDESSWDGMWRLVIYDIPKMKKYYSELFRHTLRRLNMLRLQKSVYLTPFKCEGEIEYLRQLFDIGTEVVILRVGNLENESAYKRYFGIE